MLGEFDQAKQELSNIRDELAHAERNSPPGPATPDVQFLKSRVVDLLQHIYLDSKATLEHVTAAIKSGSTTDAVAIIDRALRVKPPLKRALGSENDGRTVQALVDAAVWRSRFVWASGLGALGAMLIALALLGVNVADLNKQAETARKFVEEAKTNSESARKNLEDGIRTIQEKNKEIDDKRKDAIAGIDALNERLASKSNDVNKMIARLDEELVRLGALERDWSARRVSLANELARHDMFLTDKEGDITRKTTDFARSIAEKTDAINASVESARQNDANATLSAKAAKVSADLIDAMIGPARQSAQAVESIRNQASDVARSASESNEKTKSLVRETEEIQKRVILVETAIAASRTNIEKIAIDVKGAKDAADLAVQGASRDQLGLADFVKLQRETLRASVDVATSGATKAKEDASATINALTDVVKTRSTEVGRVADSIANLKADVIATIEDLKTRELRFKGEQDRLGVQIASALEIIKVVDDKRLGILQQLHVLLDQRPNLDSATVWKLVLSTNILFWMAICLGAISFVTLVWLVILSVRLRRVNRQPVG